MLNQPPSVSTTTRRQRSMVRRGNDAADRSPSSSPTRPSSTGRGSASLSKRWQFCEAQAALDDTRNNACAGRCSRVQTDTWFTLGPLRVVSTANCQLHGAASCPPGARTTAEWIDIATIPTSPRVLDPDSVLGFVPTYLSPLSYRVERLVLIPRRFDRCSTTERGGDLARQGAGPQPFSPVPALRGGGQSTRSGAKRASLAAHLCPVYLTLVAPISCQCPIPRAS